MAPVKAESTRLASHAVLPVGGAASLDGFGSILDVVHLTDPPAGHVVDGQFVAEQSGVSCVRLRYRDAPTENSVQTMCVVVVADRGSCEGAPRVEVDLNRFLPDGLAPGNADLLAAGQGKFYSICEPAPGAYRLEVADRPLPPLQAVVVDALTDGPYSLGDDEMEHQRAGVHTTFSGGVIDPPWIVTVSREVTSLELTEHGSVSINGEDCDTVPSCTYEPDVVRSGELLRIGYGIDPDAFMAALADASPSVREAFLSDRIGKGWDEVAAIHPGAQEAVVARLVSIEIMGQLLEDFDSIYGLRERNIRVGFWPYWLATKEISELCYPNERDVCAGIEEAVSKAEREAIDGWRSEGYDLWWTGHLDYGQEGPKRLDDRRPHVSLFAGVDAVYLVHPESVDPHTTEALVAVIDDLAATVGPQTPVQISMAGPPITANTGGEFCEADICPSDFQSSFVFAEAVLDAALNSLTFDQFVGFGVALFDGSHFDIRTPFEDFDAYSLNRVGETGYNNPVLNIWRSRSR